MAQTIQLKRSTVANTVPTTGNLGIGELAINHADLKLYAVQTVSGSVTGVVDLIQTASPGFIPALMATRFG